MEKVQVKDYHLINMADVEVKEVKWLWHPYIPYGKITIVQGDPGEGKTTLVLHLAALLTKGEALPGKEDARGREPVNVIYQNAEDGLEDTIKPRLLSAGADCNKILVIDESIDSLDMADERIVRALKETGAKVLVLDPIQAYLGAEVDINRANKIRPIMKRLGDIAEEYECAVILIGHMNKASGAKSAYRGLGSIDFYAAVRSVLVVGRVEDDPTLRMMVHSKSSLAPEGQAVAFRIGQDGLSWEGMCDYTVEDLLFARSGRGQKTNDAKAFLKEVLANGPMPSNDVIKLAEEKGIRRKTLQNAKSELGIESEKEENRWYWILHNQDGKIAML